MIALLFNRFRRLFNKVNNRLKTYVVSKSVHTCGKRLHIFGHVDIVCPENLVLGNDITINHGVYINAINPIELGNDVTISAGAKLLSSGIDYNEWSMGRKMHIHNETGIVISDHCWIGANAIVMGGISGHYVVVAAGAVVTRLVEESYCVVAGCPARIIKRYKPNKEIQSG